MSNIPECKKSNCSKPAAKKKDGHYAVYCSKECRYSDLKIIRENKCLEKYGSRHFNNRTKAKKTCVEKYGVDNPFKDTNVRKKSTDKCLKNYGVDNPSKSELIKQKKRDTCLENYGVESPLQSAVVQEKYKNTVIENYGVDNPSKSELIKQKKRDTCLENYGQTHYWKTNVCLAERKRKCIDTYGVEHHLQVAEIYEKQAKGWKEYTFPSGKQVKIQGYEDMALDILLETYREDAITTRRKMMPIIWYYFENKNRRYYPDIFIPSENLIIEVKSAWTYNLEVQKNLLKRESCENNGYNFEFMILTSDGKQLSEI